VKRNASATISVAGKAGVKLAWAATYEGNGDFPILSLGPGGSFQLLPGGSIVNKNQGEHSIAIYAGPDVERLLISGGRLEAGYSAIDSYGAQIDVTGGLVLSTGETDGPYAGHTGTIDSEGGIGAVVTVSGGEVRANIGVAIRAPQIIITGGVISSIIEKAEGHNVPALVATDTPARIDVRGGIVFSYGKDLTTHGDVFSVPDPSKLTISPPAAVIAWKQFVFQGSRKGEYNEGSSTDLYFHTDGDSAVWAVNGSQYTSGIRTRSSQQFFAFDDCGRIEVCSTRAQSITPKAQQ
jgi:hypothetical protein